MQKRDGVFMRFNMVLLSFAVLVCGDLVWKREPNQLSWQSARLLIVWSWVQSPHWVLCFPRQASKSSFSLSYTAHTSTNVMSSFQCARYGVCIIVIVRPLLHSHITPQQKDNIRRTPRRFLVARMNNFFLQNHQLLDLIPLLLLNSGLFDERLQHKGILETAVEYYNIPLDRQIGILFYQ